jgi:hypothetical protein
MDTPSDLKKTVEQLDKQLSSVTWSVRLVRFLHGLGELLTAFFLFFLFSFLVDFLIPDLPAAVRIIITASGAVGLAYLFWRSVLHPLFYKLTRKDVAAELEQAYPELNDRLISALELSSTYGDQDRVSDGMIEQLVEDLDAVLDRVRPSVIVSTRPMLKRFGTGLICTVLFCLFLVSFPDEASTWLVRLTGSNQDWPKATRIMLADSPSAEVVEGNDVRIRAVVDPESKRIPSTASLQIFEEQGPARTIEVTRRTASEGKVTYEHTVQNVREPFEYVVNAGDGETRKGSVTVLDRPRITELRIRYDYPDYTNKSDTPKDQPVTGRELSAPFDTVASVSTSVPASVQRARAYFESGQEKRDLPVSLSSSDDGQQVLQTELTMRNNGKLFFELFMKNVQEAPESPCSSPSSVCSSRFSVRTRTNQPPRVRITYPGKNKFATPNGVIPVRSKTSDDYGIKSISLTRRINDTDPTVVAFTSNHNNREYGQTAIESEYQLDLEELNVSDGDTVYYSVSANDVGREEAEPSQTKTYRLSIIPPSRMEVKLQKLQEEIRERISTLRSDQSEVKSQLAYLVDQDTSSVSNEPDRELGKRRNQQRSLAQRLKRITSELKRMERDARFNQLWDQKSRSALASIHQHASRIRSDLMSTAATRIAQAIPVANVQKRNQRLNQALTLQNETINELDALLKRMGSWYDYADIIHEWEQILESLKEVQDNSSSDTPG